jgi:hypothetical protein
MPSKLPFMMLREALNAIATAIIRAAFTGAIVAQRHFRGSSHTISSAAPQDTFGKDHIKLLSPGTRAVPL